jgi:hypothetical protein
VHTAGLRTYLHTAARSAMLAGRRRTFPLVGSSTTIYKPADTMPPPLVVLHFRPNLTKESPNITNINVRPSAVRTSRRARTFQHSEASQHDRPSASLFGAERALPKSQTVPTRPVRRVSETTARSASETPTTGRCGVVGSTDARRSVSAPPRHALDRATLATNPPASPAIPAQAAASLACHAGTRADEQRTRNQITGAALTL